MENKSQFIFFFSITLSIILLFNFFGTREVNILLAFLNVLTLFYLFYKRKLKVNGILLIFLLLLFVTTIVGFFYSNKFSIWQIIRSHIWLPLSLIILKSTSEIVKNEDVSFFEINKICNFIKFYTISIFILCVADIIFKINLSPNMFYLSENSLYTRYYYPLIEPFLFFLPILIYKNYKLTSIFLIILSFLTVTKSIIFISLYFLIFTFLLLEKGSDQKKFAIKIFVITIIILFTLFIFKSEIFFDRTYNILSFKYSSRFEQISDFKYYLNENDFKLIKLFFGSGLGSPYRSLDLFYIEDIYVLRSLVNLQYDIENGIVALVFHCGLIGSFFYMAILLNSFKKYKIFILLFIIPIFVGTSPIGVNHFFEMFFLGISINYFIYKNKKL